MALTLEKQYNYYKEHEAEYLEKYYGKVVVISDDLKVCIMETIRDAYVLGCQAFGLGKFFIQKIEREEHPGLIARMWEKVTEKEQ